MRQINKTVLMRIRLLLLLLTVLISDNALSQIVYTDITDTVISRSSVQIGTLTYILDINGDNIDDYNLTVQAQNITASGCTIVPPAMTNQSIAINTMPGFSNAAGDTAGFAASTNLNDSIGPNSHDWNIAQQNYLFSHEFTYPACVWDSTIEGNWQSGTTNYIALRFKVGANIHYGWIRISLESTHDSSDLKTISLIIHDYAYNATPNQPLLAGETGLIGIDEFSGQFSTVSVFPNPFHDVITITHSDNKPVKFRLYNSNGETIMESDLHQPTSEFKTHDIAAGIYHYAVFLGNATVQTGVLIRK